MKKKETRAEGRKVRWERGAGRRGITNRKSRGRTIKNRQTEGLLSNWSTVASHCIRVLNVLSRRWGGGWINYWAPLQKHRHRQKSFAAFELMMESDWHPDLQRGKAFFPFFKNVVYQQLENVTFPEAHLMLCLPEAPSWFCTSEHFTLSPPFVCLKMTDETLCFHSRGGEGGTSEAAVIHSDRDTGMRDGDRWRWRRRSEGGMETKEPEQEREAAWVMRDDDLCSGSSFT